MAVKVLGKVQAEQAVNQILSESVLSLEEAEREIQQVTGHKPSRPTMCRWIHKGALQAVKVGRNLITSREAVHRMLVERTSKLTIRG